MNGPGTHRHNRKSNDQASLIQPRPVRSNLRQFALKFDDTQHVRSIFSRKTMKTSAALITATLLAALCSMPALAAQPKTKAPAKSAGTTANTVAVVNGTPIQSSLANLLIQEQVAKGTPLSDELRKAVRDELVVRELFVQEAHKKGLDHTPDVQARVLMSSQGAIIGAYLDQYIKDHPISEDAIKAEYQRQVDIAGTTEYKLHHILLASEADANSVIQKLKAGEKFDALATQSLDEATKNKGGDLGWTHPNSFAEPIKQAVTALKKGDYTTTPIKTAAGYHVILLEDTRATEIPTYDSVKDRIRQVLTQTAITQHGAALKAAAKIE
jgi:peptidyl-prolyl cis-trans isomerase C